ncbi:O-antigen ligase family protein [Bradyrhizobium roseum]|uniref:O-antigen ligase family protein n=1 Tax=Bradyrhizobium roseum TaxID=3056648 RepID=UPI002636547C|nr:O-antigen ligase family protein [Bradyrhizobium roseus]WKA30568.1 O-antigen ligase family protein [Bradyrhizobium roseus]
MISATIDSSPHEASWGHNATWLLWLGCAVSLAFIQSVPTIPAIIFLGTVLAHCALFPRRVVAAITWNFVPWAMVVFGALSVLWSLEPMVSARAAPQIGITVLAAIMFAQGLPARTFIAGLMYAQLSSIVASLFIPGIFGAKNSLGLQLAMAMLSSVWVLLDRNQPKYARAIALAALLSAPYMLLSARSEGALLTGFMAVGGSIAVFLSRGLQAQARVVLLWLGIVAALVTLGIAFLSIDHLFDTFLSSIGKDSSLTGRTVLWSRAAGIISDYPWGGVGLQAFWVAGNPEAIRFWEMFFIHGHAGFHFHDLWLEVGVQLGLIGIFIAAMTVIIVVFNVWRWALRDPGPESCYFVGFVTLILLRTIGEVELFNQFNLTSLIFISAYYYADRARSGPLAQAESFPQAR